MAVDDYKELQSSAREFLDAEQGFRALRIFYGPWADRFDFAKSKLGTTTLSGGEIVRTDPELYPDFPYAHAMSASIMPLTDQDKSSQGTEQIAYNNARVEIEYRVPDYSISPPEGEDPFLIQRMDYDSEFLTLPENTYQFSGGEKLTHPVGFLIGRIILEVEVPDWPDFPYTLVQSLVGKVNNASFLNGAAGQVLFGGAQTDRRISIEGEELNQVRLRFIWRSVKWNHYYNKDASGTTVLDRFEEITPNPYDEGDFSTLLIAST